MLFSCVGGGLVCSVFVLDHVPWVVEVGKSHVVHNVHLFILYIHASSQPVGRNDATFLSVVQCREAFHGLGGPGCCSLILIDALSSACWEEEKEKCPGGFFPRARHTLMIVQYRIFVAVRCN
jgi:hypothetical protein